MHSNIIKMSPLSLYSEALRLKLGYEILPRMAIIHPTNKCNHSCTGCEYTNIHSSGSAELSAGRLLQLIDEVADLGVASILFSGGGEPTMHSSFAEVLKKAKERKLLIGIFTNGTVISQQLAEAIAQNVTFVRISVDASTPNTYAAIRQINPSVFDYLKSSVRRLVKIKDQSGSKLQIGLKFLVRPRNITEILSFVLLAKELGVENVQYKPVRNKVEEPNFEQTQIAQKLVEQAREGCSGIKVLGGVSSEIKALVPCWISPLRVIISAEGDVHLCNYFNHRRQTHTFGNINHNSLKDVWFSDAHRRALANIKLSECELYDCRFHKLNAELLDLVENYRDKLDFI